MATKDRDTSILAKSMNEAIASLEFDASGGFVDDDNEETFQKSLEFDLEETDTESDEYKFSGSDTPDPYLIMKAHVEKAERNNGRLAKALENNIAVNLASAKMIKSLAEDVRDLVEAISNLSAMPHRPALSQAQAESMAKGIKERNFDAGKSDMFAEADQPQLVSSTLKKAIVSDLVKGIDSGDIEAEEVSTIGLSIGLRTPVSDLLKSNYSPNAMAVIRKHIAFMAASN